MAEYEKLRRNRNQPPECVVIKQAIAFVFTCHKHNLKSNFQFLSRKLLQRIPGTKLQKENNTNKNCRDRTSQITTSQTDLSQLKYIRQKFQEILSDEKPVARPLGQK